MECQSRQEELVNALTHALGIVASVVGAAVLVALAFRVGDARHLLGTGIYSFSLILLYSASTCYHAARQPLTKARLRLLDHCAIYLLIAGTYTPFTVKGGGFVIRGAGRCLASSGGLALAGIGYKVILLGRFLPASPRGLLPGDGLDGRGGASSLLVQALPWSTLLWLVVGGVAYTSGARLFHNPRIRYAHAIWHGFVLVGSGCHFAAVLTQVLSIPLA